MTQLLSDVTVADITGFIHRHHNQPMLSMINFEPCYVITEDADDVVVVHSEDDETLYRCSIADVMAIVNLVLKHGMAIDESFPYKFNEYLATLVYFFLRDAGRVEDVIVEEVVAEAQNLTINNFDNKDFMMDATADMDVTEEPPEPLDHYQVNVNFVTNRKPSADRKYFSGERSEQLSYGRADVSIPKGHKSGTVERPSIWKLQLRENRDKHIVIDSVMSCEKDAFMAGLDQERKAANQVFVFIHGFNVSFNEALYKSAQLKFDLRFPGPVVLFSWPSFGDVVRYTHDINNAELASGFLKNLLVELKEMAFDEIYILAHSMGSRCLSMALQNLPDTFDQAYENLVLAAPDVDADHFAINLAKEIRRLVRNVTLYVSDSDVALKASRKVNGFRRLGDTTDGISVLDGMHTIDVAGAGSGFLKHSYISEDNRIMDDLFSLLFHKMPPEKRRLQSKFTQDKKNYWTFF